MFMFEPRDLTGGYSTMHFTRQISGYTAARSLSADCPYTISRLKSAYHRNLYRNTPYLSFV